MTQRVTVVLAGEMLAAIDALPATWGSRSEVVERALRELVRRRRRGVDQGSDMERLNLHAEELNREMADVPACQGQGIGSPRQQRSGGRRSMTTEDDT